MNKFKVDQCRSYKVIDEQGNFLHSDGSVLSRGEYWPTEKQAQAVLYKFQPAPPSRVWVHGDVFKNCAGTWVHLIRRGKPQVTSLGGPPVCGTPDVQLEGDDVKFLFNIKAVLSDRGLA